MLATLSRYLNPLEAHIVRGRLQAEGIDSYVQHEHHVWANWTLSVALGFVKVQVRYDDLPAAMVVLEKLNNGEFALEAEASQSLGLCPKCDSALSRPINWSWKLALWLMVIFSLVMPYTLFRVKCRACGRRWTQKALRGYPVWIPVFAVVLIATGFTIFERTFFYICKINYLSDVCL